MDRRDIAANLHRRNGPLYRQVADHLRAGIADGTRPIGQPLPIEAELARSFGVSLITVRAALRDLEDDGLIRKRPAKTALVISAVSQAERTREISTLADIAAAVAGATLKLAGYRLTRSAEAARVFGLDSGTMLPCLRGVLLDDATPRSDVIIYFPPEIGGRLSRADFAQPVVFTMLERKLGIEITGAITTVSADPADAGLAARLGCAEGSPILINRLMFHDAAGAVVQFTITRQRADRVSMRYQLRRR
jgi:GntR family transcriptional regulator